MTRVISIIVAVLAIALGGYYFLTQSRDDTPAPTPVSEQPAAETPAAEEEEATADEPTADQPAASEEEAAPEDEAAAVDTPAQDRPDPEPADMAGDTPAEDTQATPEGEDAAAGDSPEASEIAPDADAPADDAAGGAADGAEATADTPAGESPADTGAAPTLDVAAMSADIPMGEADAPITVIEYGSFTCPHCADFYENVHGRLKADYIDTGKVRFIHREVYFDRFGLWAGMVARCGGPLRYYGIVEMIYDTQREWIGAGENAEVIDNLKKLGRTAGLNNDQIDACLKSEPLAEALVAAYQVNAEADEITGTPSFIINGEKYPNMGYAAFAEILDGLLAE